MKFRVESATLCPGGGHVTLTVRRLPNGRSWTVFFHKGEVFDRRETVEVSKENKVQERIVSAILESGLRNPLAVRDYLVGKEFQV